MPVANFLKADIQTDAFVLQGGLDEVTPNLRLKPGVCRQASNFEAAVTGGYSRIGGYERFDGRARPADASYTIVQVLLAAVPTVGQTLMGMTSGATGQIVAGGANYLVLTLVTGSFVLAETVKVGVTTIGTTVATTVTISSELNALYLSLAANAYRALIGIVPGSGPVDVVSANFSGVHKVFAFRDNGGATARALYQATGSGWTPVPLFNEIAFTAGGASEPAEGATLTQGGNTATIKRVVRQSGSWGGSTAAGRLIVTTPTPGNFAAGAATIGGIGLTLAGAQAAITLAPGGKCEFDVGNFAGQLATLRIYGADGINRGFEFDGTVFVPIATGAAVDTPKHVHIHQKALVLTIGGSLMISGPGTPYIFDSATGGGAEIAVGDSITGLMELPGAQTSGALGVDGRNSTFILYGTAAAGLNPWQLVSFNTGVGGLDSSQQTLIDGYKLDDRGVTNLTSAKEYGNFTTSTLTFLLQNFITSKRGLLTCSTVHRTKSQYRLFFSDGSGLFMTIVNGKLIGAMPIFYANPLNAVWNGETASGEEVTYAGSLTGGFVYQLDRGSSADGQSLDASLTLAYHFLKSPRIEKHFYLASVEIQSNFYAALQFGFVLGYGSQDIAQSTPQPYTSNFSATPNFDHVSWDAFVWDGQTLSPTEVELNGDGENIQYTITSTGATIYPYTLNSIITHFAPRRAIR